MWNRKSQLWLIVGVGGVLGLGNSAVFAQSNTQKPFETERVIVKYRSNIASLGTTALLTTFSNRLDAKLEYVRPMSGGAHVLNIKKSDGISTALTTFSHQPEVEYVVPDRIMQPVMVPNDSRYAEQWDLYEEVGGINAPLAWDMTLGSAEIRVGVVDTGYRRHSDLEANMLPGYDFINDPFVGNDGDGRDNDASDPGDWILAGECGGGFPPQDRSSSWHGTHVAGTIAASINNASGVAGIAPNSKIVPVRVLGKCGGYSSDIIDGMRWAAGMAVPGAAQNEYPVRVINMSLGGSGPCDPAYESAIADLKARGVTVVVAAGNSDQDASWFTPASCTGAVTVAATNRAGGKAFYSNYGDVVDIAAPGGEKKTGLQNGILSTLNMGTQTPGEEGYGFYQGTSMATPHVAGVVALMLSVRPTSTVEQVEAFLRQSARPFPTVETAACTTSRCGAGLLDAAKATQAARDGNIEPGPTDPVLENGVPKTGLSAERKKWLHYTFTVPEGTQTLKVAISEGTGDADLFVKLGSHASRSSYTAKSEAATNNDSITLTNPAPGVYHIGIYAYKAFRGVTVVAKAEGVQP